MTEEEQTFIITGLEFLIIGQKAPAMVKRLRKRICPQNRLRNIMTVIPKLKNGGIRNNTRKDLGKS